MYLSLVGAAGLLGINVGYVLHPMWALTLVGVVIFYTTAVYVPVDVNYIFWTPVSFLLGVVVSLFAANVQELGAFVSFDHLLRSTRRALALPFVMIGIVGVSVAWALLPREPWFWLVPMVINVIAIIVTALTLYPDGMTPVKTIASHTIWLALTISYCLFVGLLDALVSRRYVPVYVLVILAIHIMLLMICNNAYVYRPIMLHVLSVPSAVFEELAAASHDNHLSKIVFNGGGPPSVPILNPPMAVDYSAGVYE